MKESPKSTKTYLTISKTKIFNFSPKRIKYIVGYPVSKELRMILVYLEIAVTV